MSARDDDPLVRLKALETQLRQLKSALSEFEHEQRRVNDGLERAGGRSPSLESRAATLAVNRTRTKAEIAQIRLRIDRIKLEMAEGEARRGKQDE